LACSRTGDAAKIAAELCVGEEGIGVTVGAEPSIREVDVGVTMGAQAVIIMPATINKFDK